MKIISFIEARQEEVIRKILQHCGPWRDPRAPALHPDRGLHPDPRALLPSVIEDSRSNPTLTSLDTPAASSSISRTCPGNREVNSIANERNSAVVAAWTGAIMRLRWLGTFPGLKDNRWNEPDACSGGEDWVTREEGRSSLNAPYSP